MADLDLKEVEKNTKSRCWFVTINNPTKEDEELWREEKCTWKAWQFEVGENGTRHIQGVVYFPSCRWFSAMKKKYPRANLQMTKNHAKAVAYCTKEESRESGPWITGSPPSLKNFVEKESKKVWEYEKHPEYLEGLTLREYQYLSCKHWAEKCCDPCVAWMNSNGEYCACREVLGKPGGAKSFHE